MSTKYDKSSLASQKNRVDELNQQSWSLKRTDPEEGLKLAVQAMEIAEHWKYEEGRIHSIKNQGACLNWLSRYEDALKKLFIALDGFENIEDKHGQIDTISCISVSFYYLGDYHNDLRYLSKSYQLATEIGDLRAQADSLNGRGTIYYTIGKNDEAISVLKQGLAIALECNEKDIQAKIYDGLGEAYNNLGRYKTALEFLSKCYDITEELGMKQVQSYALYGIGCVLLNQNKSSEAKSNLFKSLSIREDIGFTVGVAHCFNKIAECLLSEDEDDEAYDWLEKAEKLATELDAHEILRDIQLNYTTVYEKQENHKKQIEHLKKYYEYNDSVNHHKAFLKTKSLEFQFEMEKASHQRDILERKNLELKANQRELEQHFDRLETLAELGQEITSTLRIDDLMEKIYSKITALMPAEVFAIGVKDKELEVLNFPLVIEKEQRFTNTQYLLENKDRFAVKCYLEEIEIITNSLEDTYKYVDKLIAPKAGESTESILYIPLKVKDSCIGVITVQSFEKNAYSSYQINMLRTLASYVSIALENAVAYEHVNNMQLVLKESNKDIMDSLRYAKRIQEAILPPEELFENALSNYFVLYQPKEIVSGDFYWCKQIGDQFLFAVVDCTGHGVPGAFMSIVGYNALNKIVSENDVLDPAQILDQLDYHITQTLHKESAKDTIRDGMDLTIGSFNVKTNELMIASAMNPFYLIRNGVLEKFSGDRFPIGTVFKSNFAGYVNNSFQLNKDDAVYIFSDGILDQFGRDENERVSKFKHGRFREMLLALQNNTMKTQKSSIANKISKWKGDLNQTDDICMIGFKI